MKRTVFLVVAFVLVSFPAGAAEFYVALDGNNAWSGKLAAANPGKTDGPFASLERARDEVRRLKKSRALSEGVTIFVRKGVYSLPQGLRFGPEDSGTKEGPIVYRAYEGEKPVLIGGKAITGFERHQGEILKTDVNAQGFKGVHFRQLLMDGRRLHLARYPNFDAKNPYAGGWAYVDGKEIPMYQDIPGESKRTLHFRQQDAHQWARPEEGEVFIFPRYNWWNNVLRIAGMDRDNRIMTLAADASYAIRPGDRYYVQNIFEELDAPGEWYLDRKTGTLYVWPPIGEGQGGGDKPPAKRIMVAPTTRTILEIGSGTSHITIRGFTFECCEGTAIALNGTKNCLIAGNTIRSVGDYHGSGVTVNGGSNNGVVGNDISHTGSHGIHISGGDRKTLTAAGNYADNNHIHHIGVFYKQGVGMHLDGVGNRAAHNLIHEGPRMGIMFSGNNLIMEYNHVHHMNLETEDTGAIYTGGRDWISSRGSVIRYNYFHDMLGFGREKGKWVSPHFAWGIYLDDNAGGVDVIGNIVARCPRAGIHLHNGRDTLIENNIFLDSHLQQVEYNGWTDQHRYWTSHLPSMIKGYEMVVKEPAWQGMRAMQIHPTKAVLPDGLIMTGNRFLRNIISYAEPEAKLFRFSRVAFSQYESDYNLVFHHDKTIYTGQKRPGKDISANLVPNPAFKEGKEGAFPTDWQWQIRPTPQAKAMLVRDGEAKDQLALRIEAGLVKEKPRDNYPIIVSKAFAAKPGHTYRLRASLRSTEEQVPAGLMLQSYIPKAYFWANYPHDVKVGQQWKEFEFVFTIPGPGTKGYHEQMQAFRARLDYLGPTGALLVKNVSLHEVETLDEWASWQAMGFDRHSLIADPLFVDPAKDDYRLKSNSPALKLGFKPIPVEKIGPYQDPLRASWPIVEGK